MNKEFPDTSETLIEYHEKGFAHDKIDLNKLFEKEVEQGVAFELAFTAFIATVLTVVPKTGTFLDPLASLAGICLLAMTLVRKMALDSPHIESDRLLRNSLTAVLYLTICGALYMAIAFSTPIATSTGVSMYFAMTSVLFVGSILASTMYEITFRDFMMWTAIVFYNKIFSEDDSIPPRVLLLIAQISLSFSPVNYNEDHHVVKRIKSPDTDSTTTRMTAIVLFILSVVVIVIIGVFLGLPLIILVTESTLQGILLALSMVFASLVISGLTEFIYARHGIASFRDEHVSISQFKLIAVMHLIIITHAYSVASLSIPDWLPV